MTKFADMSDAELQQELDTAREKYAAVGGDVHALEQRLEMDSKLLNLADERGITDYDAASDEDIRMLAMQAEIADSSNRSAPRWGNTAASIRTWMENERATRAVDVALGVGRNSEQLDRIVRATRQGIRERVSEEGRRKKLRERTDWSERFLEDWDAASRAWDDAHAES